MSRPRFCQVCGGKIGHDPDEGGCVCVEFEDHDDQDDDDGD